MRHWYAIKQISNMLIKRCSMDAEQALRIAAAFRFGRLPLVGNKQGSLSEKHAERTQSGVSTS